MSAESSPVLNKSRHRRVGFSLDPSNNPSYKVEKMSDKNSEVDTSRDEFFKKYENTQKEDLIQEIFDIQQQYELYHNKTTLKRNEIRSLKEEIRISTVSNKNQAERVLELEDQLRITTATNEQHAKTVSEQHAKRILELQEQLRKMTASKEKHEKRVLELEILTQDLEKTLNGFYVSPEFKQFHIEVKNSIEDMCSSYEAKFKKAPRTLDEKKMAVSWYEQLFKEKDIKLVLNDDLQKHKWVHAKHPELYDEYTAMRDYIFENLQKSYLASLCGHMSRKSMTADRKRLKAMEKCHSLKKPMSTKLLLLPEVLKEHEESKNNDLTCNLTSDTAVASGLMGHFSGYKPKLNQDKSNDDKRSKKK